MSELSIAVDTEDKAALKAVYTMLRSLMCGGASIPEVEPAPAEDKPTLSVVPQPPADDGVEPTYNVDGRSYSAEDIRSAGFTVEHLKRAGLLVSEIVDVLGVTAELVEATPVSDLGGETQATPDAGAELDTKGMLWDSRIHAGTKTKIGDGSWKMKRGVDKAIVEQVEAELINLMEIPAATGVGLDTVSEIPTNTTTDIPPPPADNQGDGLVVPPPPTTQTVTDPNIVLTPKEDLDDAMTFAEFLKACSVKMTAGETDMARILEVVNAKGIASLQLVNSRQDLIPELWATISAHEKVAQ